MSFITTIDRGLSTLPAAATGSALDLRQYFTPPATPSTRIPFRLMEIHMLASDVVLTGPYPNVLQGLVYARALARFAAADLWSSAVMFPPFCVH